MNPNYHSNSFFVLKNLKSLERSDVAGATIGETFLEAQEEFTLALRDVRNTVETLAYNEKLLRRRVQLSLKVKAAMYQCASALTVVIPEGPAYGTNNLYPHTHCGVRYFGWEDRSKNFPSNTRNARYLEDTLSAVFQQDISARQRHMRDPRETLKYACKGYGHTDHLPALVLTPVVARISDEVLTKKYSKTRGESHLIQSDFMQYRQGKIAQAAANLIRFMQTRNDADLMSVVQQFYDLECALKLLLKKRKDDSKGRQNKAAEKAKQQVRKRVKHEADTLEIAYQITVQEAAIERFRPVAHALEKAGVSSKEVERRKKKVRRHAIKPKKLVRKVTQLVKERITYYQQRRRDSYQHTHRIMSQMLGGYTPSHDSC